MLIKLLDDMTLEVLDRIVSQLAVFSDMLLELFEAEPCINALFLNLIAQDLRRQ